MAVLYKNWRMQQRCSWNGSFWMDERSTDCDKRTTIWRFGNPEWLGRTCIDYKKNTTHLSNTPKWNESMNTFKGLFYYGQTPAGVIERNLLWSNSISNFARYEAIWNSRSCCIQHGQVKIAVGLLGAYRANYWKWDVCHLGCYIDKGAK